MPFDDAGFLVETTPETKPHPVIEGMRRALRERGWCQFALENRKGAVCLLGAHGVAVNGDAQHVGFSDVMSALIQVCGITIATFNNASGRTIEEIFDALDRAEKLLAERS